MTELIQKAMEAMKKNGFDVLYAKNAEEGKKACLSLVSEGKSVGIGGCMTAGELELIPAYQAKGCTVWCHTGAKPEEAQLIRRKAMNADYYLCSPNAITKDGKLVLVDGTGNRVGAVCYGPENLIFVAGVNKVVDGGFSTALGRIKTIAAPMNAKRLGRTPRCLEEGLCDGDECKAGLCCLTLCVDRLPNQKKVTVVLIDEKLGY